MKAYFVSTEQDTVVETDVYEGFDFDAQYDIFSTFEEAKAELLKIFEEEIHCLQAKIRGVSEQLQKETCVFVPLGQLR